MLFDCKDAFPAAMIRKINFSRVVNIMVIERTGDCMFKTIPIGEVDYYIENENDMMVIDLRNAASYQRAHINGAVNIPYEEIDQRISELPRDKILLCERRTKYDGLPLSGPYGVLCAECGQRNRLLPRKISGSRVNLLTDTPCKT